MDTTTYVSAGTTCFRMEGNIHVPSQVKIEGIQAQLDGITDADPNFKIYFDEWNSEIQPLSHA